MTQNIMEYKKNSSIFIKGQKPYNIFFMVLSGNILIKDHVLANETLVLKKWDFLGVISAILKEPYFTTAIALNDVTLIEIEVDDMFNTYNGAIINDIIKYLIKTFNICVKKYYNVISNHICQKDYQSDSLINIANAYKETGYFNTAKHMYIKYLELFKGFEKDYAEDMIEEIGHIKDSEIIGKNLIRYNKNACIFAEYENDNNVYFIKSGRVGLYKSICQKKIMQIIFIEDNFLNIESAFENKSRMETAIALENTVLAKIGKKRFIEEFTKNKELRNYIIKFISELIFILNTKIESPYIKSYPGKLYNLIYSFSKLEHFHQNDKYHIKIPYNIDELIDIAGIEHRKWKDNLIDIIKNTNYIYMNNNDIFIKNILLLKNDLIYYK